MYDVDTLGYFQYHHRQFHHRHHVVLLRTDIYFGRISSSFKIMTVCLNENVTQWCYKTKTTAALLLHCLNLTLDMPQISPEDALLHAFPMLPVPALCFLTCPMLLRGRTKRSEPPVRGIGRGGRLCRPPTLLLQERH